MPIFMTWYVQKQTYRLLSIPKSARWMDWQRTFGWTRLGNTSSYETVFATPCYNLLLKLHQGVDHWGSVIHWSQLNVDICCGCLLSSILIFQNIAKRQLLNAFPRTTNWEWHQKTAGWVNCTQTTHLSYLWWYLWKWYNFYHVLDLETS